MAWIRNNLCIAGLTDENDAMMTLMGAEEVQHSLAGILKKLDDQQLLGTERRPSVPTGEPSLEINTLRRPSVAIDEPSLDTNMLRRPSVPIEEPPLDINKQSEAKGQDSLLATGFV